MRRAAFGQNLIPERPAGVEGDVLGTLLVGDDVEVLEDGAHWPADGR